MLLQQEDTQGLIKDKGIQFQDLHVKPVQPKFSTNSRI